MTIVTIGGADFTVKTLDPTHVSMLMVGAVTGTAWVYHVGQLGAETVRQLKVAGAMDIRGYMRTEGV